MGHRPPYGDGVAGMIGESYRLDVTLKGSESTARFEQCEAEHAHGPASPDAGTIGFQAPAGMADPGVRRQIEGLLGEVDRCP